MGEHFWKLKRSLSYSSLRRHLPVGLASLSTHGDVAVSSDQGYCSALYDANTRECETDAARWVATSNRYMVASRWQRDTDLLMSIYDGAGSQSAI